MTASVGSEKPVTEFPFRHRPPAIGNAFRFACILLALGFTVVFSACGGKKAARVSVPPPPEKPPAAGPSPSAKSGGAPEATFPPQARPIYVETGIASWYGPPYHNRRGANGEIYNMNALTAAHRTLPLNSMVRVTNLQTGHSTMVRITDRGPFIEGRIIDLSVAAAKKVDVWRPGTAEVRLEVFDAPAAIDHGGRWCVQIGAFRTKVEALQFKQQLQDRYRTANVLEFPGPTGEWIRIRVLGDDKRRAESLMRETKSPEGAVFLVRLD